MVANIKLQIMINESENLKATISICLRILLIFFQNYRFSDIITLQKV